MRQYRMIVAAATLLVIFLFAPAAEAQGLNGDLLQLRQQTANFLQLDSVARRQLLVNLRKLGPAAEFATDRLLQVWQEADSRTDDRLLAGVLDVFRSMGRSGSRAAKPLSSYLRHEAELYWNRDQLEVARLRAYLMVTLQEIGLPADAYPHLLDSLAHADEHSSPIEIGSAARALWSEGQRARQFIPHLISVIAMESAEEEISLLRYDVEFPEAEATTPQLEALRSLAAMCRPDDENAIVLLRRLSSSPPTSRWDARARKLAQEALRTIQPK
jgi:hypothetical protein